MHLESALIILFIDLALARFGQEQGNGAITAIGELGDLGSSGQAATLAGGSIQFLLAAANPCQKLVQADKIVSELGDSERSIAAARGLVAAEQNFNPFVASAPSVCADPKLPVTESLRGVVPLVDPAVTGQDIENANSATSIKTPFKADGMSVAQVMSAQGFSNFTAVMPDGTKVVDAAGNKGGAAGGDQKKSDDKNQKNSGATSKNDSDNKGGQEKNEDKNQKNSGATSKNDSDNKGGQEKNEDKNQKNSGATSKNDSDNKGGQEKNEDKNQKNTGAASKNGSENKGGQEKNEDKNQKSSGASSKNNPNNNEAQDENEKGQDEKA